MELIGQLRYTQRKAINSYKRSKKEYGTARKKFMKKYKIYEVKHVILKKNNCQKCMAPDIQYCLHKRTTETRHFRPRKERGSEGDKSWQLYRQNLTPPNHRNALDPSFEGLSPSK